ncbi:ABC transporter ATP-binding protein [Oharaeibacter diazotrophicus]|uniref:Carbohydrate ABC transporter ATP-binding protein (CUT1 family) n=1 Tax=Oharaeibacter diazotrophicus TaxID=1920512 RepID=A0A4R6R8Y8_9HYPH|nr:ABC transporter ATP-binding protein [Oharaeibacter diazotrophicus]TDP82510.1 carbohydrate ABC transporter ATP-binding protein (CUT1 family) [Oharaeibacter diazotrophicus]BBE72726.1 trehalose import ATP-binding protein SugC [Pleomorphomonas sp. SM30]GLS76762.1 ABC transporter ATP-binding protein [Oharaeibacter diazotrophicus]
MAEVALHGVTRAFGDTVAVDDLSLTVGDGEFVVLLGPTGAGKTTTLRCVAGIEPLDRGSVSIGGRDVTKASPAERDVTFVFQQYSLYPHLTVYDNLAFPLRSPARRRPEAEIAERVRAVATMLRIDAKLGNKATRLSGGEMQRVAIGRALVRTPSVYLMDEPLSSLDAKLRADLRLELKRIQQDLGATLIYVTHDQIEAMTMATRIGVMDRGRLVQFGTPREIYEDPADVYVATRLGTPRINLLPMGALPVGGAPAAAAWMGLRTEHVEIRPAGAAAAAGADATVERVERLGDQTHLHLALGAEKMVTLTDAHAPLARGDRVTVAARAPLFFDRDGRRIGAVRGARA